MKPLQDYLSFLCQYGFILMRVIFGLSVFCAAILGVAHLADFLCGGPQGDVTVAPILLSYAFLSGWVIYSRGNPITRRKI